MKRLTAAIMAAVMLMVMVQLPASAANKRDLFNADDCDGITCSSFDDIKEFLKLRDTGKVTFNEYDCLDTLCKEMWNCLYVPKAYAGKAPDSIWLDHYRIEPGYKDGSLRFDICNCYESSGKEDHEYMVKRCIDSSAGTDDITYKQLSFNSMDIYCVNYDYGSECDLYWQQYGRYFELRVFSPEKQPEDYLYLCELEKVPLYDGDLPVIKDAIVPYKGVPESLFSHQWGECICVDGYFYSMYTTGLDMSDKSYADDVRRELNNPANRGYTFPTMEEFKKLSPVGIYNIDGKPYYNVYVTGNAAILEKIGTKHLYVTFRVPQKYLYCHEWVTKKDADGVKYKFYVSGKGAACTGIISHPSLNGVYIDCGSDGVYKGRYTGWAKALGGMVYLKNGVGCYDKWLTTKSGKTYYIDKAGYLRTGWAVTSKDLDDARKGWFSYFGKNGVWDGKEYWTDYNVRDLNTVFTDLPFFGADKFYYVFNTHDQAKMKPFYGRKVLYEILKPDMRKKLLWDIRVNDCETEPAEIYHGGRKLVIRSEISKFVDLEFTKDKNGDCWVYGSYLGFGMKLSDRNAYDKLLKAFELTEDDEDIN